MLGTTFYNQSIRKALVAFGTLFNDISIDRSDGTDTTRIKIPLSYAPRARFVQRLSQESQSDTEVQMTLPRMSFEWTDLTFDSTRKLNTLNRMGTHSSSGYVNYQWERVPYDITISLAIFALTTEDGLKIVEQILPYFTPEFTVSINDVIKTDIPVVLSGVSQDDVWEGGFTEERRMITWTLDFTLKTYLYGPSKESKIIQKAIAQIYGNSGMLIADLTMTSEHQSTDNFLIGETVYQGFSYDSATATAEVISWDSSTRVLRISGISGTFKVNEWVRVMGAGRQRFLNTYSNINQDVQSSLDLATVRTTTVPDPSTSGVAGWTPVTTIDEFP